MIIPGNRLDKRISDKELRVRSGHAFTSQNDSGQNTNVADMSCAACPQTNDNRNTSGGGEFVNLTNSTSSEDLQESVIPAGCIGGRQDDP
ncbi:hypothetical protein J6590_013278 [Homalodisca vitripennis]|nr:hypothetical protein J6590_013278 [Homalodisca vitripennis]